MELTDFLSGLTQARDPEKDEIRIAVIINLGDLGMWSGVLSVPPGKYDGLTVLNTALRILDEERARGNTQIVSLNLVDMDDASVTWSDSPHRRAELAYWQAMETQS